MNVSTETTDNRQVEPAQRMRATMCAARVRFTWLNELAPTVIPKTELAAAVGYALNQWEALVRYCDEGWLLIDNTRSERALRAHRHRSIELDVLRQ